MLKKIMTYLVVAAVYLALPVAITCIFSGVNGNLSENAAIVGRKINVKYKNVTKTVAMEEFVKMALAYRYKSTDETEFLKAEAVMIRTDVVRIMGDNDQADSSDFSMNYLTENEMKNNWGDNFEEYYAKIKAAVDDTKGQVIMYNGNYIEAKYTEVSCGSTLDGLKILGDNYGYLKAVECPSDMESSGYLAVRVFTKNEFIKAITSKYKDAGIDSIDPASSIVILSKTTEGYVISIQVGNVIMSGEKFAQLLGVNSNCMAVEKLEDNVKVTTKGIGNGFGVSLYSANKAASEGMGYQDILRKYYSGISIVSE